MTRYLTHRLLLALPTLLGVAVLIARPTGGPATAVAEPSPVEDAEILASNDGPELYADDPDFYEWAESEPNGGPG